MALNLPDRKKEEISRGDVIAFKNSMYPSMMADVSLTVLRHTERVVKNGSRVHIYHGTKELLGKVILLDREELKAGETVNTLSMLLGNIRGTIGETSVVAIMIGAMFLILMGVIDLRIPGTYIVTFVIFITLFGGHGFDPQYITAHLCGGGLMLGAWFMATDYVTSPITSKGKILFGICLGCMTGLFRLFGGSAEGVSYAIIISNLLVPLIEKVTLPKPFGKGGEK